MSNDRKKRRIKIAGRIIQMPGSPFSRLMLGVALILGGILGFLPILGFWMVPLGFLVLSVDYVPVRRFRRKLETRVLRWWRKRF